MAETRDPIADLRRIAYLLERAHEATYRVRAFRGAAVTLAALPEGELAARADAGTLTDLPGIGEVTARCVIESLDGEQPAYLRRLYEAAEAEQAAEAAADADGQAAAEGEGRSAGGHARVAAGALRAALRGDCHCHSDWSDGGSPIEEMVATAIELGHEYLVLTDHSPRLTVARGLSAERLLRQLDTVAAVNEQVAGLAADGRLARPFRLLAGIEVDILADGTLDQRDDLLDRLDLVVGSVHGGLRDDSPTMTRRMVAALANPRLDILGHCTGRLITGRSRRESTFDAEAVFGAAVEYAKAIEINSRPERLDPPKRLLTQALEAGCRFAIDTDAHAPGQLDWLGNGCARAVACGVPPERVVNTMPAGDLLTWTASHR